MLHAAHQKVTSVGAVAVLVPGWLLLQLLHPMLSAAVWSLHRCRWLSGWGLAWVMV
jgi:hypothetical protein